MENNLRAPGQKSRQDYGVCEISLHKGNRWIPGNIDQVAA